MFAAVLLCAIDHTLEHVQTQLFLLGSTVSIQLVFPEPQLWVKWGIHINFVVVIEVVLDSVLLLLDCQRDVLDKAIGTLEAVGHFRVVIGESADGGLWNGDAGLCQERCFYGWLQQRLASATTQSQRKKENGNRAELVLPHYSFPHCEQARRNVVFYFPSQTQG